MFARIAIALLAACLGTAAVADDAKYVKLLHKESGKVLGIEAENTDAGGKTMLVKDGDSEFLQWSIEKAGDHLKLTNRKTGKVLDVNEASADEGASIIQWDDKAEENDNQRWSWLGEGKTRRLKAKGSGHVLDLGDNDMIVQKKLDEKSKTQLWEIVEVKSK